MKVPHRAELAVKTWRYRSNSINKFSLQIIVSRWRDPREKVLAAPLFGPSIWTTRGERVADTSIC